MEKVPTGSFPATRHSILAAIQSDDSFEKSRGLDAITAAYWKPVYKYLRLRWKLNSADAQDLTQDFFTRLIERDFLSGYDPSKGRLRTYLRTCADKLFLKQSRDAHRAKRGGAIPPLHLDFDEAERELARTIFSSSDTMEKHFEKEWIRSLFTLALDRLRSKYVRSEKMVYFHLFERYDLAEDEGSRLSYVQLAAEFGLSVTDVTNYLAAARRQFRQCVLDQLRDMTASEEEFQSEARALLGARTE
jgi:RNA polymerase sigma factor (sigma-70 family)